MSSSKSDHGQDGSGLGESLGSTKQSTDQTTSDSFTNPIASENLTSTDSSIPTTDSSENPFTKLGQLTVCTIDTSYFPGKGILVEIKNNGETVQVTRPYGLGVDILFSMRDNVSYSARFLTQQVFL